MFKLNTEKIKPLSFLLSTITEQDEQFKTPKYSFFLGSGCSISSNIPAAKGVIKICQKFSFVENHPEGYLIDKKLKNNHSRYCEEVNKFISPKNGEFVSFINSKEKHFKDSIGKKELINRIPNNLIAKLKDEESLSEDAFINKVYSLFIDKIHFDNLYSKWFEEYSQDPRTRQQLIEGIVEEQKVAGEYILFANLIAHGLIHNIFTTNFDDLIFESLITYVNKKARVYAHNEIAKYISIGSNKPNIIKLHGDYLYENIKNVLDETTELEKNMKYKFKEALKYLDLIVVGYGGADVSIMSLLEELKHERPFRLLWCGKELDNLNWRVINLINNTQNSFFLHLDSFSTLVLKLWNTFNVPLNNIIESATEKQKELKDYVAKYTVSVQENARIPKEEQEAFANSIKASEYLRLAYEEKDQDEKIRLYTEGINFYPNEVALYNDRGVAFASINKHRKAIRDFTIAIESNKAPNFEHLYLTNRAISYITNNEYQKAMDDLDKAISIKPTHGLAWANKGSALYKMGGANKDVLTFLNKAIDVTPNEADVYSNRGYFYLENKNYDLAEKDFKKAEELQPKYHNKANLYNNFAVLYRRLKKFDKAKQFINKARQFNPKLPLIDGTLSLIYADQGDTDNFFKYLTIALKNRCPAWNYLDDYGFDKYRENKQLKKLIKKYKAKYIAEDN